MNVKNHFLITISILLVTDLVILFNIPKTSSWLSFSHHFTGVICPQIPKAFKYSYRIIRTYGTKKRTI